jgi:predicted Abi (CAAX) family protease
VRSLEKEPVTARAWWPKIRPFLVATIVVILYLAVILNLGGMDL